MGANRLAPRHFSVCLPNSVAAVQAPRSSLRRGAREVRQDCACREIECASLAPSAGRVGKREKSHRCSAVRAVGAQSATSLTGVTITGTVRRTADTMIDRAHVLFRGSTAAAASDDYEFRCWPSAPEFDVTSGCWTTLGNGTSILRRVHDSGLSPMKRRVIRRHPESKDPKTTGRRSPTTGSATIMANRRPGMAARQSADRWQRVLSAMGVTIAR